MTVSQTPPEVVADWLMGVNVNPVSLPEPYQSVLRKAVEHTSRNNVFRPAALEAALDDLGAEAGIRDSINRAAATSLGEEAESEDNDLSIPSLPRGVRYDPRLAQQSGHWVDCYVAWANAASPMTPTIFHESAALTLGSIAIARRLVTHMPYGNIYPNLYTLWLAQSTLYRKTTAFSKMRGLAREVMPHLLAPQDATPEALFESMSGREPANLDKLPDPVRKRWELSRDFSAQTGLVLDEMSGLLNGSRKDYNAGLVEAFLRFYDCDDEFTRLTATKGLLVIRNAYVTLLGASTPAALAQYLTPEQMWANGWWPRFALLTPDTTQPVWRPATDMGQPIELKGTLGAILSRLPSPVYPDPPEARPVLLGTGVSDLLDSYAKVMTCDFLTPALDSRLWALYGRLPTQLLKVATILSALDWATTGKPGPTIEMPHFVRALLYVEKCRESAHRVLQTATRTHHQKIRDRVLTKIAASEPVGITMRDLSRSMPNDVEDSGLQRAVADLIAVGEVCEVDCSSGSQGGRPTIRYRIAED